MNAKPWIVFLSFFIFLNTLFFYGFVRDGKAFYKTMFRVYKSFFRDTHWNEHGIATAARAVCETLQAPACTPSES